jgi:VWFA-related protein
VALILGACAAGADRPSAQEGPTFRSGIDVVQLDVSVLDRDHHPVRDLTAADFTVLEDGHPQAVVAFQAFNVPDPVIPATRWMHEVAPDVITNRPFTGRLVVVVLDDLMQRFAGRYWTDAWTTATSSRIIDTIMNQIGPEDLVSVVFTDDNTRAQDFTADRVLIRAPAVNRFQSLQGFMRPRTAVALRPRARRTAARIRCPAGRASAA